MKEEIRDVLRWKVPMLVYESVEEADTAAGEVGAVLKEALNNLLYRGTYNDARELIQEIVIELTGIEPEQKPTGKNDEKGNPILEVSETEKKFVDRALAQAAKDGKPITDAQVQEIIDQRARGYDVTDAAGKVTHVPALAADITHTVRQAPKVRKLPDTYLATATGIFDKGNSADLVKLVKKDLNEDLVLTGDKAKDVLLMGWALKRHMEWRQAAMLAQYAN